MEYTNIYPEIYYIICKKVINLLDHFKIYYIKSYNDSIRNKKNIKCDSGGNA